MESEFETRHACSPTTVLPGAGVGKRDARTDRSRSLCVLVDRPYICIANTTSGIHMPCPHICHGPWFDSRSLDVSTDSLQRGQPARARPLRTYKKAYGGYAPCRRSRTTYNKLEHAGRSIDTIRSGRARPRPRADSTSAGRPAGIGRHAMSFVLFFWYGRTPTPARTSALFVHSASTEKDKDNRCFFIDTKIDR